MQAAQVSVIVPARDAGETLGAALDGLADQGPGVEVIVVENGSLDATAAVAERHPLAPRIVRRARGEGPGAARNAGAAAAAGGVLAFLDADCAPRPGWVAAGLRGLARADLVQGAVRPPDGVAAGPFDRTLWVSMETGLYESANLFVRREWFERAGGFRDWTAGDGRPFGEDVDFAWRVKRAGGRTAFAADALVHHAVFAGSAACYLAERRRDAAFPALVARVPELRSAFLYRRLFLTRRSAAFDLALAGALLAVSRRAPVAVAAALPWLTLVDAEARRRTGVRSVRTAAVLAAGDAVRLGALLQGSVAARTFVL